MTATPSAGRGMRIDGERVALRWDAGDVLSVIAFENLWHDLPEQLDFMLLCGLRADQILAELAHGDALFSRSHPKQSDLDMRAGRNGGTGPRPPPRVCLFGSPG